MVKVKFTLGRRADGQGDSYIPPQTSFAGGIIIFSLYQGHTAHPVLWCWHVFARSLIVQMLNDKTLSTRPFRLHWASSFSGLAAVYFIYCVLLLCYRIMFVHVRPLAEDLTLSFRDACWQPDLPVSIWGCRKITGNNTQVTWHDTFK